MSSRSFPLQWPEGWTRAIESMLGTRVHVSAMLPVLIQGRGWVHDVLLPANPLFMQPEILVVSPLAHWLLKYDQANKIMRAKARWWFR